MTALRKNTNTGKCLGVCSGISEWTFDLCNESGIRFLKGWGVNVWLIRIPVFVICCTGIGFYFYAHIGDGWSDTAECIDPADGG